MNFPTTLKTTLIQGLRKEITRYFTKNQSIRGFFDFESSFQNCIWNLFNTSGFSEIGKIRNVWRLSSPYSALKL
jgi:hypothetical protein